MDKQFTLVQLRYFQAVAQHENMTAAAAGLNVTQSTLSSAIGHLERELGVQLFTRLPRRGLALTGAGRRLLAGSAALLEEAELLARSVGEDDGTLTGELRVGIFSALAPFRAPVILEQFEARHPGVRVTLLEADQERLRLTVERGQCELALMYDLGLGPDLRLDRQVVETIPPHVLVHEDHPLASAPHQEVSLHDLAEEPFILLDLPHSREYYLTLFRMLGIEPRIRYLTSGYETVRSFVARGHGYSVLNQRLHSDVTYAGGRVVPLRIVEDLPEIRVLLVRPAGTRPTARARAFEEVTRALYGVT